MPKFSRTSQRRLSQCRPELQELFEKVCEEYDCKILCGHRGQEEQDWLFDNARSKVRYPNGRHNKTPSAAVDVIPWPAPAWEDHKSFVYFAGFVKGVAFGMGFKTRWGGDWDSDNDLNDQTFNDLVHFEWVG